MPFGGIQLVLCGDFFQLPPVIKKGSEPSSVKFMFEAAAWRENELRPVVLRQVFRQKERGFVDLLDQMRRGKLSAFSISQLYAVAHPPDMFRPHPLRNPAQAASAGGGGGGASSGATNEGNATAANATAATANAANATTAAAANATAATAAATANATAANAAASDATGAIVAASPFASAASAAGRRPFRQRRPLTSPLPSSSPEAPPAPPPPSAAVVAAGTCGDAGGGGASSAEVPPSVTHNLSTRLFPRNDDAERANDEKLHALASTPGGRELHHWIAHDEGVTQPHLNGCIVQTRLSLRQGAQVRSNARNA